MNTGTLSVLFLLITKVLFATFVVGLVAAGIIFIKDTLFTEEEKAKFRGIFTSNHVTTQKKTCNTCGKELNSEWKTCPYCEKTIENEIVIEAECKNA